MGVYVCNVNCSNFNILLLLKQTTTQFNQHFTHSLNPCPSLSLSHSPTHTISVSLSLSLSHTHTHTHTHTYIHAFKNTQTYNFLTFIRSRGRQIAALFEKRHASLIWDSIWAAGVVVFSSYMMSRQMAAHPAHCAMLLGLSLVLK
jgi:hypothetical protein